MVMQMLNERQAQALGAVLARSQQYGFLGPGDPSRHIEHATGLVKHLQQSFSASDFKGADLGSGGGVPGLIVALTIPQSTWLFIEAMEKRAHFLDEGLKDLGLASRVSVVNQRAETVGRDVLYRAQFDVVSSRSFGLPAITAECAAPLLKVGGVMIVSEPPGPDEDRWPSDGLAELGMSVGENHAGWRCINQETLCGNRYPRRVGVPNKRPLWSS